MATITARIVVKVAWWFDPYLAAISIFCQAFGTTPDFDKVIAFAIKGLSIEMVKC